MIAPRCRCLAVLLAIAVAVPALAGPYEDASAAIEARELAEAIARQRDLVGLGLSSPLVEEAQRLAREWKPKR